VIAVDHAGPFGTPAQTLRASHSQEAERHEGYTKSRRFRYCLVVVDLLTRYPIFIPVTDVRASTTIKALEEGVYPKFGPPDILISDKGSAFKSVAMEAHCDRFGIFHDMVSPGNHRANGLAERYVGTLHDAMTHLADDQPADWHKLCEPIAHCLRTTPCSDTLVTPIEMLTGRRIKHPYVQPVDVAFVRADVVERKERRQSYIRARAMIKRDQEVNETPLRPYVRAVQTFKVGDFILMKVENSDAPPPIRKATQVDSTVG
jgi:transposase InsO family protein